MSKTIQLTVQQAQKLAKGEVVHIGEYQVESRPARGGWVTMVSHLGYTGIIVYGSCDEEINDELASACAQHGWEV